MINMIFLDQIFFLPKFLFRTKICSTKNCWPKILFGMTRVVILDLIHDLGHGVQSGAEYGGSGFPTKARFLMLIPEWILDYEKYFLAVMSSSRSDVVTKCVRPSVRPSLFFSFCVLEVSSSPEEFQWCFKPV